MRPPRRERHAAQLPQAALNGVVHGGGHARAHEGVTRALADTGRSPRQTTPATPPLEVSRRRVTRRMVPQTMAQLMRTNTQTTTTPGPKDGPIAAVPTTVRKVVAVAAPLFTGPRRVGTPVPTATTAIRAQAGAGGATGTRKEGPKVGPGAPRADRRCPLRPPSVAVLSTNEILALVHCVGKERAGWGVGGYTLAPRTPGPKQNARARGTPGHCAVGSVSGTPGPCPR